MALPPLSGRALEVVRAEILVEGTGREHVPDSDQHRGLDRHDRLLRPAPRPPAIVQRPVVAPLRPRRRPRHLRQCVSQPRVPLSDGCGLAREARSGGGLASALARPRQAPCACPADSPSPGRPEPSSRPPAPPTPGAGTPPWTPSAHRSRLARPANRAGPQGPSSSSRSSASPSDVPSPGGTGAHARHHRLLVHVRPALRSITTLMTSSGADDVPAGPGRLFECDFLVRDVGPGGPFQHCGFPEAPRAMPTIGLQTPKKSKDGLPPPRTDL